MDKPTIYLDKILEFLAKDFYKNHNLNEIQNHLTPVKIFGKSDDIVFDQELTKDLQTALIFLKNEGYVTFNRIDDIKISYSGYLKIKTNSYHKNLKDNNINKWLQRIAWTLPIIISITAILISIFKK